METKTMEALEEKNEDGSCYMCNGSHQCQACDGDGYMDDVPCDACGGTGVCQACQD